MSFTIQILEMKKMVCQLNPTVIHIEELIWCLGIEIDKETFLEKKSPELTYIQIPQCKVLMYISENKSQKVGTSIFTAITFLIWLEPKNGTLNLSVSISH